MAKVSFDGINKIISVIIEPVDGVIDIDVQIDLYSDWKEWILLSDNAKYLQAMRIVGGDPLPGSKQLGSTYFLMNGWRIRPYEGNQVLNVNGNLYTEEGDSPFIATLGSFNVMISSTVSSLVDSTIQQLPEIEYASFGGGVSIDVINGMPGTDYPSGTLQSPVDNLADALVIANTRGFKTLFILESMTLSSGIITNFKISGRSHVLTEVVLEADLVCSGVNIDNCHVEGVLDGGTHISDCMVADITYVNGHIHDSGLHGTIILDGDEDAVFMNCNAVDPYSLPIIDMNDSGQNCVLSDWSGQMTLKNMTGTGTGENATKISIQIDGGKIILDSSINTPTGKIGINGIGLIEDNATQYGLLNTDGLLNREQLAKPTWEEVFIDTINGESGTVFPFGTITNPVSNIADARLIAEKNGIRKFHVRGSITLTGDWSEYTFNSHTYTANEVICSNAILEKTKFRDINLSGSSSSGKFVANDCIFQDGFTNLDVIMEDTQLSGTFTVSSAGSMLGDGCYSGGSAVINMNSSTGSLQLGNFSGVITIANFTNPASAIAISGHYLCTLLDTCTAGIIMLAGIGTFTDYSTGMTTINVTVPESIWTSLISGETTGDMLAKVKSIVNDNQALILSK